MNQEEMTDVRDYQRNHAPTDCVIECEPLFDAELGNWAWETIPALTRELDHIAESGGHSPTYTELGQLMRLVYRAIEQRGMVRQVTLRFPQKK